VRYALLVLCLPSVAFSQATISGTTNVRHDRPITISRAVRASAPIDLDGRLNEPAWATAPVTDSFTQIDPDEGRPASQRTEVRVMYDDAFLYVGARLHDSGRITGRLGRRDMDFGDSDWFGVMIDSYLDHRTAFGFDVNPAGVRHDEVKTIDVDDYSWDPVWETATTVDSAGWTAEYRIPFSQLRFSSLREQVWGVQFERIIGRNREYAVSTFIPKSIRGGGAAVRSLVRRPGHPSRQAHRGAALHRAARVVCRSRREPVPRQARPGDRGGTRPAVPRELEHYGERGIQSRLRPGGSRPGGREPRRL
jgi:hypothetical protein